MNPSLSPHPVLLELCKSVKLFMKIKGRSGVLHPVTLFCIALSIYAIWSGGEAKGKGANFLDLQLSPVPHSHVVPAQPHGLIYVPDKLERCMVTMSIRSSEGGCFKRGLRDMKLYAEKQGAKFFAVLDSNHESLKRRCDVDIRYAKIDIVRYFLGLCRNVLWMDDTFRFDPNMPSLFDLQSQAKDKILAATDTYKLRLKVTNVFVDACQVFGLSEASCVAYYNRTNTFFFNSGLMVIGDNLHVPPLSCKRLKQYVKGGRKFRDQPFFNALGPFHNTTWLNLNTIVPRRLKVYQGSELASEHEETVEYKLYHVTRGARNQRAKWLCNSNGNSV